MQHFLSQMITANYTLDTATASYWYPTPPRCLCVKCLAVERDELVGVGGQVCDGDAALLPDKLGHALQLLPR